MDKKSSNVCDSAFIQLSKSVNDLELIPKFTVHIYKYLLKCSTVYMNNKR